MWFQNFYDTFYKCFIKEDRYQLLLDGIGVTVKVSLLAVVFGLLIGFGAAAVSLYVTAFVCAVLGFVVLPVNALVSGALLGSGCLCAAAGMGAQQTQDNGADSLYHVKCGMGNVTITFK